jgi:acyl carrier protein
MTADQLRSKVLALLSDIAPEADLARLKHDVNVREQLDIDSMDLLNFMIRLNKEFGVEIPERDYSKMLTIDDFVAYLCRAQGQLPASKAP